MNAHTSLLGVYEPGDGWLFRLPIGAKYLLMLAVAIVPIIVGSWWATLLAIVVVILLLPLLPAINKKRKDAFTE